MGLAGYAVLCDLAVRDVREPTKPSPAKPSSIMAHVEDSGTVSETAPPSAKSKPKPPGPLATRL